MQICTTLTHRRCLPTRPQTCNIHCIKHEAFDIWYSDTLNQLARQTMCIPYSIAGMLPEPDASNVCNVKHNSTSRRVLMSHYKFSNNIILSLHMPLQCIKSSIWTSSNASDVLHISRALRPWSKMELIVLHPVLLFSSISHFFCVSLLSNRWEATTFASLRAVILLKSRELSRLRQSAATFSSPLQYSTSKSWVESSIGFVRVLSKKYRDFLWPVGSLSV